MGTTGPPGVELPAEKGFTVFVYLPQTVCLVVYGAPRPPNFQPQCLLPLCVLSATHGNMPFTDTHHPVIKMPGGSIRSVFVRNSSQAFPPTEPQRSGEEAGE